MSDSLSLFDYAAFDQDTAVFLQEKTAEVKALMRQTVENVIRTGMILWEVRERIPDGQWLIWIQTEFGWTQRTAHRMMSVAEQFPLDNLANEKILASAAASALYILAAPSTPEEAREEARLLAEQGHKINVATAQKLRDSHLDDEPQFQSRKKPSVQQTLPISTPDADKPPQGKRLRLKKSPDALPPNLKADKTLITSKAKSIEPGHTWRLGGSHILFCGIPTDPKFLKRISHKTPLLLEFPPSNHHLLPPEFKDHFLSCLSFTTQLHMDFDLGVIREAIEIAIEGTTDGGDGIVLNFLPDPAIFILIDQLECTAYCAEPDPQKCNMAIAAWTTVTKRAASQT